MSDRTSLSTSRLAETELLFRLLVASVKDYAIFMLDTTGHVLSWNAGAERIKGYSRDEIVGQHFSRFYPQEAIDRRWPDYELERAEADGRFEDEGWRIRKDGTPFWANVVITAIRTPEGELVGFGKVTRDLTERRAHEETLRAAHHELEQRVILRTAELQAERQRLLVTLTSIGDAVITTDPEGQVTFINRVAEGLTGWRSDEVVGWPLESVFRIFHEQTREPVDNPVKEVLRDGRVQGLAENTVLIGHDGIERPIDDSAAPIRDEAGKILGVVMTFRDVTAARRTEEIRSEIERRLRQSVEELREADRQKNQFLAMLAHELRNPLAPVRNALHVLQRTGASPSDRQSARDMMDRQVQHLSRLIDDLLDVSRVMQDRIELRREQVEIRSLLDRAIEIAQPVVSERRQQLTVSVDPQSFRLSVDPTRMSQAISNLLINAAKYSDIAAPIILEARRGKDEILVRVRDQGVGIRPEFLPHVFDLFAQADQSLDRSQGGLGVGLALVRKLTELHGGQVEARSGGPGQGSEFTIHLPLTQDPLDSEGRDGDKSPMVATASRKVLVVDDNVDAAESTAMLLRLSGHDVQVAFDGPGALALVDEFAPEIVLLDIGLPDMNGYQVAHQIRARPHSKDAILIAITGYGQAEDRQRSLDAGFNHHLTKPFDPDDLDALIASLGASE